jgi:hypothetical protein
MAICHRQVIHTVSVIELHRAAAQRRILLTCTLSSRSMPFRSRWPVVIVWSIAQHAVGSNGQLHATRSCIAMSARSEIRSARPHDALDRG